jgi:hypothetical protein
MAMANKNNNKKKTDIRKKMEEITPQRKNGLNIMNRPRWGLKLVIVSAANKSDSSHVLGLVTGAPIIHQPGFLASRLKFGKLWCKKKK